MQNHPNSTFIINILKSLTTHLDEQGIDFYIVGAIGAYIDAGLPLQRAHTDLDILIEEKYVPALASIFTSPDDTASPDANPVSHVLSEFAFHDHRLTSDKTLNPHGYPDGHHEVYAQHLHSDFHIGFFLYQRDDTSYTMIDYLRKGGTLQKLSRTLPIKFFDAQYNPNPVTYHNLQLRVARKETIYKNKLVMHRPKDLFDLQQLRPTIDPTQLAALHGLSQHRQTTITPVSPIQA